MPSKPETGPPPPPLPAERTAAVPPPDWRFGWFDGVLRGPVRGDFVELRLLRDRLRELHPGCFHVVTEGDRFSIFADDTVFLRGEFDAGRLTALAAAFSELLRTGRAPSSIETTLRCTFVGETAVRECLFVPQDAGFEVFARERRPDPMDYLRDPARGREGECSRRQVLAGWAAGLALAALSGGLAWRRGLFGSLGLDAAARVAFDPGPFAGLLEMEIRKRLFAYEVVARYARGVPRTRAAFDGLVAAARGPRRTALERLKSGGLLWVRAENKRGRVLEERQLYCAPPWSMGRAKTTLSLSLELARIGFALEPSGGE